LSSRNIWIPQKQRGRPTIKVYRLPPTFRRRLRPPPIYIDATFVGSMRYTASRF
jgi:hypothetical protein